MKYFISKYTIDKVITLFNDNPFTEFIIDNLNTIRRITGLGFADIKNIILEYNMSKSVRHPERMKMYAELTSNSKK